MVRWVSTLSVVLGGCASGPAPLPEPSDSEVLAVILAALDHHLPDGLAFESVAFDIENVTPAQARITAELAERWELVSCDEEITIPRSCEIRGFDWIVRVGVPRFDGNRAPSTVLQTPTGEEIARLGTARPRQLGAPSR